MAIQFSGGTIIHEQVDAGTKAALIAGLRQALLDAGWTQTGGGAAYTTGTFTGLPSNTQTVTIDGTVYTFKSALANAYDVKIGADGTACASNLVDAIMDNSANEGTTYGTGTNAHPTCSASYLLGVITVTYRTAGISGNGVAVSKTLSNFTWAWAALQYGGSILRSVTTPDGLSMKLRIDDDGTAYARITPFSSDEAISGVSCFLAVSASRLLEVQACRYQIMVYLLGSSTTASTCFFATVPKLRTVNVPSVIASVADDGSGKFQVTTATAHGLATGQHVYIYGAQGVVGLNGAFQITVTGDSTYVLNGSTYAAGYVANSAVSAGPGKIARAIMVCGQAAAGTQVTLRQSVYAQFVGAYQTNWLVFNQFAYSLSNVTTWSWKFATTALPQDSGVTVTPMTFGGYPDEIEPRVLWPLAAAVSNSFAVGTIWNSYIVGATCSIDVELLSFLGYNWRQITASNYMSLWMVTTAAA